MRHSNDAFATMLLMSQMVAGKEELVSPLSVSEYYALRAITTEKMPGSFGDLLNMDMSGLMMKLGVSEKEAFRLCMLMGRMLPLSMSLEQFYGSGIDVLTLDDKEYPDILRNRLGEKAPPMLYFAGRVEILRQNAIGIVGAQPMKGETEEHARALVRDAARLGYSIVSEGGTGLSDVVIDEAEKAGTFVTVCIADSLTERMKKGLLAEAVKKRIALACSLTHPDTPYTIPHALRRNKCVYGLSRAVFVFSSEKEKGSTWDGACEALRNHYCDFIYTWDTDLYSGNRALLTKGAKPFGVGTPSVAELSLRWISASAEQLSMFDGMEN